MVEFCLVIWRPKGQQFKSWNKQTGLLYDLIPVDLCKIELTQIIQACGALAIIVNLQWGALL